jgi:hypothetical protein
MSVARLWYSDNNGDVEQVFVATERSVTCHVNSATVMHATIEELSRQ